MGGTAVAAPESFVRQCSKDATCVDDPTGELHPPLQEIMDVFLEGYLQASDALCATIERSPGGRG